MKNGGETVKPSEKEAREIAEAHGIKPEAIEPFIYGLKIGASMSQQEAWNCGFSSAM